MAYCADNSKAALTDSEGASISSANFGMKCKGYIYGDWKDRSKPYRKIACILLDVKSVMENYSASASAQRELRNIIPRNERNEMTKQYFFD